MESTISHNQSPKIQILVALWGEKFINDFLKLNLRSLLAPGNIPALACEYPLCFVVLTTKDDIPVFENNSVFKILKTMCAVEFITINDLIVFANYSTTLTLAYDRAVKNTGEQMLNTYFIFLTSDYIMADGSFVGLMRYIKKGYSGICAGNFQVIEEEIKPFLRKHIDKKTQILSVKPRELLKKSFQNLHPISFTNIYHQNLSHNYYANRFFLQYNADVMAGRFYLLHMLCIKPETMNYKIGSSCDYSFIPEMCPSGNIAIIKDSDDYLVVELQSKTRDLTFIQSGTYHFNKMASALAEWTTLQHRENAKHTIYYHTKDLNAKDTSIIEEKLDEFINVKLQKLKKYKAKPHHDHPYWIGAIKAFEEQKLILQNKKIYDYLDFSVNDTFAKKLYYQLFGIPPLVFFWHHRWSEYRSVRKEIQNYLTLQNHHETAIFYNSYENDFMRYSKWLKNSLKITQQFYAKELLNSKVKLKELKNKKFKTCIFFIRIEDLSNSQKILLMIRSLLKKGSKLVIFIPNNRNFNSRFLYDFTGEFINRVNYIRNSPFEIIEIHSIFNNLTFWGEIVMHQIKKAYHYNRKIKFLVFGICAIPGIFFSCIKNIFSQFLKKNDHHCTNIMVELAPTEEHMT